MKQKVVPRKLIDKWGIQQKKEELESGKESQSFPQRRRDC